MFLEIICFQYESSFYNNTTLPPSERNVNLVSISNIRNIYLQCLSAVLLTDPGHISYDGRAPCACGKSIQY